MVQTKLISDLPGEGLDAFIEEYQSCSADLPFDTWLILPTARLVQYAQNIITEKNVPYIPARICTLEDFCRNYFEENRTTSRFLSKAEAKLLLTYVLIKNKENLPLFFSRSQPSSGTLDDLQTFISVVITRKVVFPECLIELQSEKSDQIDLIISEYRSYLKDQDLVDNDTIKEWTIDHLTASDMDNYGHVFIYGIHKPLPLEQDLIQVLRKRSKSFSCFIPAGLDPNIFDDSLEWMREIEDRPTFNPPISYLAKLTGIFSNTESFDSGGRIRLVTFPSHYAELQGIAAEICHLNRSGVPLSDIYVAFPELREEFGIIEEVFSDFNINWNARISPKLSQYPVIRFLIGIIGVVANRYIREDVVRMVNSPYFQTEKSRLYPDEIDLVSRLAMIEGDRSKWLEKLDRFFTSLSNETGKKMRGINPHSVERVIYGIERLFKDLKGLEGKKSVKDFIHEYRRFLFAYDLPNISCLSDNDIRIKETFLTRLDTLSHTPWFSSEQKVSLDEFHRMVKTIADESDGSIRQETEGVSVLGIRECVHQHLPHLFICGLVEGAIPRLTTRLPFTNSLENVRMGTRSLADILHEQEYYFITALLSGEKLYLSAPLAEGDKPLLTSAFFETVREQCSPEEWNFSSEDKISCSRSISAIRAGELIGADFVCHAVGSITNSDTIDDLVNRINIERYYRTGLSDSRYDGVLSDDELISAILTERYGPEHVYSPTSLETYAKCPFQFFLKDVIHLEDLPEVEPNLSAADRGTAVHNILSAFYRRWFDLGNSRVCPSTMIQAVELMREIVEEELAKYSFDSPIWEATCIQMKGSGHAGPGYFERFLTKESDEEASPLVPSYFEFSFGMEKEITDDPTSVEEPVELTGSEASEKLRIRGRIDRVDLSSDGFFLIFDYKTGAKHPGLKDIEAGKALQLPLYLLAFESVSGKRGVAAGYYKIRREAERKMLLCDENGKNLIISRTRLSRDFPGILKMSRDYALEYIQRIRKGDFSLLLEEKCPNEYCEFQRICRFNPYRVFESEGGK